MRNNYSKKLLKKISALSCGIFLSCILFSQTQYGWIEKASFPGFARHRISAAAVGNRGYMGLGHVNAVNDILYDDWFEYDPGSDTWTQRANYAGGPRMHPATFVIDNKIYVGTGRDISLVQHQDFWRYDPVTNVWDSIAPYPGAARRGAVAFTLNGLGYVGTGSYHSNFYKYDPNSDSWSPVAPLPGTGRISAVAFAINGKGYLTTGDDGTGPLGDMWEYDPTFDTWTPKANLPGLPRMEAAGFALNGQGYVGTGDNFSSGINYQDFWCYDPPTNSWMQVTDFTGAARRYMGCFVIGNRAYAGLGTSGTNYNDLWEYGSISGVQENNSTNSISIFPNPVYESATIHFSNSIEDGTLTLTDVNGKCVREIKNINGNSVLFNREELASGIYFISIFEKTKMIPVSNVGKIVLE
jgi:N-acetylneuraminic acid mutarotase